MKRILRQTFLNALLLFGTYSAYAWLVIGPERLSQPERSVVKAIMLFYVPLASGLLAFGRPRLLATCKPALRRFIAILCFCAIWLYGAYAIADAFSVYFGNTWTTLEILLGFIVLNWPAMLLMATATLGYGLALAHADEA